MSLTFTDEDGKTARIENIAIPAEADEKTIAEAVIDAVKEKGSITVDGEEITLTVSPKGDNGYTIRATGRKHIVSMKSNVQLEPLAKAEYGHNASSVTWDLIDDIAVGGSDGEGSFVVTVGSTSVNVPASGTFPARTPALDIANAIRDAVNTATGSTYAFVSYNSSSGKYRVWVAPHSQGLNYNVRPGNTYSGGWQLPSTVSRNGNAYDINETVTIPKESSVGESRVTITLGGKTIALVDKIDDGTLQADIFAKVKEALGNTVTYIPNGSSKAINLDVTYDDTNCSFTVKSKDDGDVSIYKQELNYSFMSTATPKGKADAAEDEDALVKTPMTEADALAVLTGTYGVNADEAFSVKLEGASGKAQNNASILFTVTGAAYDTASNMGTITLSAVSNVLESDGISKTYEDQKIIISTNHKSVNLGSLLGEDDDHFTLELKNDFDDISKFKMGDKFVYNICGIGDVMKAPADTSIFVAGTQDSDWPYNWDKDNGSYLTRKNTKVQYNINAEAASNKEVHFRSFYLNSETGKVYDGDITLDMNADFKDAAKNFTGNPVTAAAFTANYVGKIAGGDTKLRDLEQFWNTHTGVFMLEQPQVITVSQNDGKSASITLNASDTLNDLRAKLNDAISEGLGQSKYTSGSQANNFVSFVETPQSGGMESVKGTMLIRSVIPGYNGELTFSSSYGALIDALGLNTVQASEDGSYTASVYDAHSGTVIAQNVKTSGNMLSGVIGKNIDVEFDAMSGVNAVWSESDRNFILTPEKASSTSYLHIVKNNISFQTGANTGEDITLDIGDMSSGGLGLQGINVMTHERASDAIGILDAAIRQVSAQRTKIGSYQNELEHTLEALTLSSTNLTNAESRIRDADMSKSMMDLVKFQIIHQSGTSMLAQANQLPQSVLNLMQ